MIGNIKILLLRLYESELHVTMPVVNNLCGILCIPRLGGNMVRFNEKHRPVARTNIFAKKKYYLKANSMEFFN